MGCDASAIPGPRRNLGVAGIDTNSQGCKIHSSNAAPDMFSCMSERFYSIVSGCSVMAVCPNMFPVVCLTQNSFPIINYYLQMQEQTPTEIQLPIIAGAIFESGRIICFSQSDFISPHYLQIGETERIIENAINWVCGGYSSMTSILVMGFSKSNVSFITHALQKMGFLTESSSKHFSNLDEYKALIIPSSLTFDNLEQISCFKEYLRSGGGLAVFYTPNESDQISIPVNSFLSSVGLSFTYCILNQDSLSQSTIQIPSSYQSVKDSHFISIASKFKSIIRQSNIDPNILDDLVTTLGYYIMVSDIHQKPLLLDIASAGWNYLKSTNYSTPEGICPDIRHGIVVVLLQDIYSRLPVTDKAPFPEQPSFPGVAESVELRDFEISLDSPPDSWTSTGLWLPAGVEATVSFLSVLDSPQDPKNQNMPFVLSSEEEEEEENYSDSDGSSLINSLQIQIGSHSTLLLTKQGPWKRWPSVISTFPIISNNLNVGTRFDGMLYLINISPENQKSMKVTLKCNNFCEYPRVVIGDPGVWERTKDLNVPWGEFQSEKIIFTLPSDKLRRLVNDQSSGGGIDDFAKRFDKIADSVRSYISDISTHPYRIVFDVEVANEDQIVPYPLVLQIDTIDQIIFNESKPTPELYNCISMLALSGIRNDCFDSTIENAISKVCAASILQDLYPSFDPLDFNDVEPPILFVEFWDIHKNFDKTLIPRTLQKFQNPNYPVSDVPEDMWIAFVRDMCTIGKKDFTKLLEHARPIPLNISNSVQGLPLYKE